MKVIKYFRDDSVYGVKPLFCMLKFDKVTNCYYLSFCVDRRNGVVRLSFEVCNYYAAFSLFNQKVLFILSQRY